MTSVKITLNLDKKSTEYRGLCFYQKGPRLFWKGSRRMSTCSFNLSSDSSDIDILMMETLKINAVRDDEVG